MYKSFSISGYLLSRLQPDDPQEARLRMLCEMCIRDSRISTPAMTLA